MHKGVFSNNLESYPNTNNLEHVLIMHKFKELNTPLKLVIKLIRANIMFYYSLFLNLSFLKPLSHQSGVLTAFPQLFKKLQIFEVHAVQSPATLCVRCAIV